MLSESYRKRIQALAGIDKKMLNEDMHPQFMDFGFYDMSNGDADGLMSILNDSGVEFKYDSYRNFITIPTDNPREILPMLEASDIEKVPLDQLEDYFEDPNDCVLITAKSAPNPPPGAMM